jgi:hypothetical protein
MERKDTYEYTDVEWEPSAQVIVRTTDPKLLAWVKNELGQFLPNYQVYSSGEDVSGEAYFLWLKKLNNRDSAVAWWIIKRLCHQGWEPFATDRLWVGLRKGIRH